MPAPARLVVATSVDHHCLGQILVFWDRKALFKAADILNVQAEQDGTQQSSWVTRREPGSPLSGHVLDTISFGLDTVLRRRWARFGKCSSVSFRFFGGHRI